MLSTFQTYSLREYAFALRACPWSNLMIASRDQLLTPQERTDASSSQYFAAPADRRTDARTHAATLPWRGRDTNTFYSALRHTSPRLARAAFAAVRGFIKRCAFKLVLVGAMI
eukprot:3272454-Rhodomonas_salina.1